MIRIRMMDAATQSVSEATLWNDVNCSEQSIQQDVELTNMQLLEAAARNFLNDASNCKSLQKIDELFVPSLTNPTPYSLDFEDDPHITLFVSTLGLPNNVLKIFEANNTNFFQLIISTDSDLKALGIAASKVREKILNAIKSFHLARFKHETLPYVNPDNFSMGDAVNVMSNVALQLEFLIGATNYVRKCCSNNPVLLPMQDHNQYSVVLDIVANKSMQQSKVFVKELKKLKKVAQQLQTEDDFSDPDFVAGSWMKRKDKSPKKIKYFVQICAVALLATASLVTFCRLRV